MMEIMEKKVEELESLKQFKKEVEERIKELEAGIKAYMTELNVEVLKTELHTVYYKEVISERFNTTAFKKENAAMYSEYLVPSVSKRFEVR